MFQLTPMFPRSAILNVKVYFRSEKNPREKHNAIALSEQKGTATNHFVRKLLFLMRFLAFTLLSIGSTVILLYIREAIQIQK